MCHLVLVIVSFPMTLLLPLIYACIRLHFPVCAVLNFTAINLLFDSRIIFKNDTIWNSEYIYRLFYWVWSMCSARACSEYFHGSIVSSCITQTCWWTHTAMKYVNGWILLYLLNICLYYTITWYIVKIFIELLKSSLWSTHEVFVIYLL